MGRYPTTTPETWIEAAKDCLLREGIAGVRIDRLASKLNVSRGGFYHYFRDRADLLDQLLEHWQRNCRFFPDESILAEEGSARRWLDRVARHFIELDGYDYRFDLAVRGWARSHARAARAIERADHHRLTILEKFFDALGYDDASSRIRARIFYYQQIGYYALGVSQDPAGRRRMLDDYLNLLCGREQLAALGTHDP